MSRSARWTAVVLIVFVALAVALWREIGTDRTAAPGSTEEAPTARDHRDADTPAALQGPRAAAGLPPCPGPGPNPQPGPPALRGITLECAGDGELVDLAPALAGRPVVLNLWAYWCGPCTDELPAMAEYQRRMGTAVSVVTVHQDENESAGLMRMAELGVHLPMLQDGRRLVAAALKVPNVMPATVVLRADGSVAEILPRPFAHADDIAAAVNPSIGVPG
ncbi:TlpA family protein disulfide reductase [Mycolicibacterium fluoranthenivorans]|uniref:TlpA family protein disulfide reductase n=1 Tax=Mycolicibacterium fluoranthenivorans TaxID=258505 RepID=A0A7G8PF64_9MYCO|nr:TlpA disulfide reductase family protein [Mycolicibacterium fluoranthenivorans]QNJ92980.1 TlpA family protein disulfide reductase [Mycolicibacterium fluoranthenivorans]